MSFTDAELISHQRALLSFAKGLCKDHTQAEDLVQDTLMKAVIHQDKFESGTNLKAWLFTILRHVFYTERRKHGRMIEDPDMILAYRLMAADDPHVVLEAKQTVAQLRYLPSQVRRALLAVAIHGGKYEEAAEDIGVPVGTIKSRINRGRVMLETGLYQEVSEIEFDLSQTTSEIENDTTRWHDTIRILYITHNLDVSEISAKINLPKADVMTAIVDMKLKRKKIVVNKE